MRLPGAWCCKEVRIIDRIKFVLTELGEEEVLCQLAEECDELGKAALKLRRALSGKNPTPVTVEQALENLLEEIADVELCLEVLGFGVYEIAVQVGEIWAEKVPRWVQRITEAKERSC